MREGIADRDGCETTLWADRQLLHGHVFGRLFNQQFWAEEKRVQTKLKMGINKGEKQAGRGEVARRDRTGRAEVVLRPEIFRPVPTCGPLPVRLQATGGERAEK